jgi:hypothetical protein
MSPLAGGADAAALDLSRPELFLAGLNERIARLAIALHVPLNSEADVLAAMHTLRQDEAELALEKAHADYSPRHVGEHAKLLQQSLRGELRGLLVLRYGVEQRCVEKFGVEATRLIMAQAEQQLQREGFQPGADGVDLQRIFE